MNPPWASHQAWCVLYPPIIVVVHKIFIKYQLGFLTMYHLCWITTKKGLQNTFCKIHDLTHMFKEFPLCNEKVPKTRKMHRISQMVRNWSGFWQNATFLPARKKYPSQKFPQIEKSQCTRGWANPAGGQTQPGLLYNLILLPNRLMEFPILECNPS